MVISKKKKKKRSSPKFELLFFAVPHRHLSKFPDFAQIFRIAARKIIVLPKYFLLTARKILILPKSSKLGGQLPSLPPRQVRLCHWPLQIKDYMYILRMYIQVTNNTLVTASTGSAVEAFELFIILLEDTV